MDSNKQKVAVLGGGISGLSAAWYLQSQKDFDVQLIESSHRLGGVIGTLYDSGRILELGADNFATLIPDAWNWTQELGIESSMIRPNAANRLARVVRGGKLFPIPQGFSLMQPTRMDAILASRVLSLPGKLRLLGEYFIPKRAEDADESLKEFAIRRLGKEAFERLVEPIVGGIFTAQSEKLSMRAAMPEFVAMETQHGGLIRAFLAKRKASATNEEQQRNFQAKQAAGARYEQFVAPENGMQWWLDQIESKLTHVTLHRNTKVEQLVRSQEGWQIEFADRGPMKVDGVVVALPAPEATKVFARLHPKLSQELSAISYASSAVVAMIVDRREVSPQDLCFGLVVPQVERRESLAISMSSEKYPGRVGENELLLRVFIGGAVRPELFAKEDDALLATAWKEVRELLGVKTPPIWQRVVRWGEAMPQYHVGHLDRLNRIEAALSELPGIYLAGNAYRGVGIPQCVRSGRLAAEKMGPYLRTLA